LAGGGGSPDRILAVAAGVVSLASIVALAALAYSGIALYQSFTGAVNSFSAFNDSRTSLSAFNITNGGLFPTSLGISANLSINGVNHPAVAHQLELQPGESGTFNLSIPLSVEDAVREPGILQAVLFSGVTVNLTVGYNVALAPFLTVTAQSSQNLEVPPVVSNIDVRVGSTNPYNSTHAEVSLIYSFSDDAPVSLNGTLGVVVTDSPSGGRLIGSGAGPFVANAHSLNQGKLSIIADQRLLTPGVYYANVTITSSGEAASVLVSFTYSQGG
jgi:hypothetical protein